MKNSAAVLLALLATRNVCANFQGVAGGVGHLNAGVVVAVDKKSFTIKPEDGKKITLNFDPNMGKNPKGYFHPNDPSSATPDKIKAGRILRVQYTKEKDVFVCKSALIIFERLGAREIDFSPMLAKGKDTLPEFTLLLELQTREKLGIFRPKTKISIDFKEGATIKEVRDIVKGVLTRRDTGNRKLVAGLTLNGSLNERNWQVKEVGDAKLLIESYREKDKDEPINAVEVSAKKLPKDRQPRVRRIDPQDPTKSLDSDDAESRPSEKRDRR